jgi:hypothetical protein
VVYDRYENCLWVFRLEGNRYKEMELEPLGFWFDDLSLGLGVWQGSYEGVEGKWLRWFDEKHCWVSSSAEREQKLASRLRELGIDPNSL